MRIISLFGFLACCACCFATSKDSIVVNSFDRVGAIQPLFNNNITSHPDGGPFTSEYSKCLLDFRTLKTAPAEIFDYPVVREALVKYIEAIYLGNVPPFFNENSPVPSVGYQYAPIYFFGFVVLFPYPVSDFGIKENLYQAYYCPAEVTCICPGKTMLCKLCHAITINAIKICSPGDKCNTCFFSSGIEHTKFKITNCK